MDKEIAVLIADEIEAVKGYHKALEIFKDKPEVSSVIKHIMKEELEHIELLDGLS